MIDLDFSAEQDMLRDMVRGVCAEHAPLEIVRSLEDDPVGVAGDLWSRLGDLGICGLNVSEELGGSGMSLLDGVVVYEELGRALAPVPHFVSCVVTAGLLERAARPAGSEHLELLAALAAGRSISTVAWLEPDAGFLASPADAATLGTRAVPHDGGWLLDGTKRHVYFARAADQLLVPARTEPKGLDLFLVDPNASGVNLTQQFSISSDSQYRVDFDRVEVAASARVSEAGTGWALWDSVMQDALVLAAAQAVGGARYALEVTVEYSQVREQFGKPLAAFQALSHYLADARTNLDAARHLVYEAAWAVDRTSAGRPGERPPRPELAPMAKSLACRTYRDITAMAQQVFGGVGFTVEYDIQLYFRRAKQLQLSWWDERTCEQRIAESLLGPA